MKASNSLWIPILLLVAASATLPGRAQAQPAHTLDLATASTDDGTLRRIHGSKGTGRFGVPVTGGNDVDGDGFADYAVAYFTADVGDAVRAGEVNLVFGNGTTRGILDTATDHPTLLRFFGSGPSETAGSEIWMDDVTGDGLGDLLIARQNLTPDEGRIGAGGLTIIVGGPELRALAAAGEAVSLAAPPEGLRVLTLIGALALDRLGIWMRTGDIDGDGIADIVVGADQEDLELPPPTPLGAAILETNRGAAYVIRGGNHLTSLASAANSIIDLANFGSTALAGHLAKITPPRGSERFHFGATCQIADLDGNTRGEVVVAATLLRAGASIAAAGASSRTAESSGGSPQGTVYIAWDDNFAGDWPPGYTFDISESPGSHTSLDGGLLNLRFGEELLGGLDYNGDGEADLFVGDLVGGNLPDRSRPGIGHIFYSAGSLKGLELDLDALPNDLRTTTILGPSANAIASDTAAHGDFDGDGLADLALSSPHANPQGRIQAGAYHILYGHPEGWPELIDTHADFLPAPSEVRITELQGAQGAADDRGDVLGYSADAADLNGDGRADLISNEMQGNGVADGVIDVGNLILVDGAFLSGLSDLCTTTGTALCLQGQRFVVTAEWRDFNGNTGSGQVVRVDSSDSGLLWFFDADNWELLVKVLDGCSVNNHFWVFSAATTNVEYTLRVVDVLTGEEQTYINPLGMSADAITDTAAFATCP